MSDPELTVGRRVIEELVRMAAFEVPGVARVGRGGAAWRRVLAGPPLSVHLRNDQVLVRMWIVARPGQAIGPLSSQVRAAVGATIERLLGLELGGVTVFIDGVGG